MLEFVIHIIESQCIAKQFVNAFKEVGFKILSSVRRMKKYLRRLARYVNERGSFI